LTANKADFDAAGIKVVGVSADDVTSHKNFAPSSPLRLVFSLIPSPKLMKTLGLGQSEWKGKPGRA
jgi:peroxiredoxin